MNILVGIDVGGTFTDLSVFDTQTGTIFYHKLSSTPDDPSKAIVQGIEDVLSLRGIQPEKVSYLAHGTTVATNALIQKKGGKTGLLTTQGFRDLLELGRQTRPNLYDLRKASVPPIVPGALRLELDERLLFDGSVETPLDEAQVRSMVRKLREEAVEAIAVCTLFSFVNPVHEQRIEEIIREEFPGVYISISSKVVPEFREYSRLSTTVVNAFLGPVMEKYVDNFQKAVRDIGIATSPYITQSTGSIISIQEAKSNPVRTALSGPSAGVVAAGYLANQIGLENLITFDMGGTSADISLVANGAFRLAAEKSIEGYPVRIPMVDIETVGAGGGSIAYIDNGGVLKVGPQSAGAQPGPAAYDRGGSLPTVTDANIVLGRLNPQYILGGRMAVHKDLAEKALQENICTQTDLSVLEAARGIVAVVNSNMVRTTRVVSVERGYDVRDFALVAFGGAGPLHACEIAEELDIKKAIIPPSPGTLCSLGLLTADIKYDYVITSIMDADEANAAQINGVFDELVQRGRDFLKQEGVSASDQRFERRVDARYKMQNYELTIPVTADAVDEACVAQIREVFHIEHEKNYGHCDKTQPVQFVNFRLAAVGLREKPVPHLEKRSESAPKPTDTRLVYLNQAVGFVPCPIYNREQLLAGDCMEGPMIIEQMDSTILITPGWRVSLDHTGALILDYIAKGDGVYES